MKTQSAEEIAARYAKKASGNDIDYKGSWVVKAMKKYSDQQNKAWSETRDILNNRIKMLSKDNKSITSQRDRLLEGLKKLRDEAEGRQNWTAINVLIESLITESEK